MNTVSTRRTFVGGAVVAAAALGSIALLRGGDDAPLRSGVIPAKSDLTPAAGVAGNSPEIQRWAAEIGQPVRIASAAGGTTGRISQVLSTPKRKVPAGVREQSFIVYFELDKTATPLTEGLFDITAPIEGLSKVFMSFSQDRGAKTIMLAVFG